MPSAPKGTGLRVKGDQASYRSMSGRTEYVSVNSADYRTLPRVDNPNTVDNLVRASKVRTRIRREVILPLLKDLTVLTAYAKLSESYTSEMLLFQEDIIKAVSRHLKQQYRLLLNIDKQIDRSDPAHSRRVNLAMGQIKAEIEFVNGRASGLYNRTLRALSQEISKDKPDAIRISRLLAPATYQNVNHHSLSRGLASIQRSSLQRARFNAQYQLYAEANVQYVQWRLSGSHKDYGGSEICEVLANTTGNLASRARSDRGLYLLSEAPQPPHPNCMCSLVPTK